MFPPRRSTRGPAPRLRSAARRVEPSQVSSVLEEFEFTTLWRTPSSNTSVRKYPKPAATWNAPELNFLSLNPAPPKVTSHLPLEGPRSCASAAAIGAVAGLGSGAYAGRGARAELSGAKL